MPPFPECSYLRVKPDGVQRGLVGQIVSRFENKGFKLVGLRMLAPEKDLLECHYSDLRSKKFFSGGWFE